MKSKKPAGIVWTTITKKTVVPGLEIEKGRKYFVKRGELGVGERTMYLLEEHPKHASLGIVLGRKGKWKSVLHPGAFTSVEKARAAAIKHDRTGKPVHGDWTEKTRAKPVHPSLKVIMCLCGHTKSRHRGAWGEPHAGACKDCVCEQFELEKEPAIAEEPKFVWKKEWSKKAHPAAKLLPMLNAAELAELAADIKANHQKEPITLTSADLVLDGRNRLEACKIAGVEPEFAYWLEEEDGASPTQWVLSKNVHRRHLTPSQAALIGAGAISLFEKEARARQRAGVTAPGQQGSAAHHAGVTVGAGERSVARARAVIASAPAAEIEKIRTGEKTLKQVERETKRAEQREQIKVYVPPKGKFQIVTTDFSWPYRDKLDGSDLVRGGPPYPPMTLLEIVEFIRGPLASCCDETCVLGNWITGPISLDLNIAPVVQREIEALGFKPLHERIWQKEEASGADFTGLGRGIRWDAEKLQLYVRGNVLLNEMGREHGRPLQSTVFRAPIGEHSEKPAKAYEDLAELVPYTSRLEMFSRAPRPGWVTSGAELPSKKPEPGSPGWVCPRGCGKEYGEHDGTKCPKERKLTPIQKKPGYEPIGKEQRA